MRNTTAYVIASEGFKAGISADLVEREVRAYCESSGIPDEARSVLASAHRRVRR
jgi:hypothetical protein